MNHSRLARRKFDLGIAGLLGEKLHCHSRGASQLSALSRSKLYVMNHRAQRNVAQRKGIAHEDIGAVARNHCRAYGQAVRSQNVAFLPVGVGQQRNSRRPVRIVFESRDLRRNIPLVPSEVENAVQALMSPTPVPDLDVPLVVPPGNPLPRRRETF